MPHNSSALGQRHRRWFYGTFVLLFLSGAIWWALHAWGRIDGEFGPQEHPLTPWMLRLHGAAAMASLVLLGTLLPGHVEKSWRANRNRPNGGGLLVLCAALTVTGYGLYYLANESLRVFTSWSHSLLGLGFPLVIGWHIQRGRASRRPGHGAKPRSPHGSDNPS